LSTAAPPLASRPAVPRLAVPRAPGLTGLLGGVHPWGPVSVGAALAVPPLTSTYWTFNVMVGLVLAIACLGLLVLVGWAREISLMQAGLAGASLYISGYLYRDLGDGDAYPFPLAAAVGVAFAVAVSLATAFVAARLAAAYVVVLTLSVQFLLENTVMLSERLTGGLALLSTSRPTFFGLSMRSDSRFYYVVLATVVVCLLVLFRLRRSRFGRSMILVGADHRAAAVVGVSPWRYRVWAFGVAGAFAGVAGALAGPLYFSPPGTLQYISFNSLFYLAVPMLAGFDSPVAVVWVAVVFTLIPQVVLSWKINVYLLGGAGLLAGVFLGPRGLGGVKADALRRRPVRPDVWSEMA
jgi:branched-chain amino acid transport system permease protein